MKSLVFIMLIFLGMSATLNVADMSSDGLPFLPFFVVMSITPLAPRAPYMAAAEASLRICIDSISVGLIWLTSLTIIPSSTYKGPTVLKEPIPLIITLLIAPGWLVVDTETPGT